MEDEGEAEDEDEDEETPPSPITWRSKWKQKFEEMWCKTVKCSSGMAARAVCGERHRGRGLHGLE